MFDDNVTYLVGSANAQLADQMKNFQKSTVLQVSDLNDNNLDFKILKISCKKESLKENKNHTLRDKIIDFIKFNRIFRLILFLIISVIVSFSVYKIIDSFIFGNKIQFFSFDSNSSSNMKRNAQFYNILDDWSGEKIPAIYELDPITFYDSNNDGFGDLTGIGLKLDYLQRVLKINCLLIKNIQYSYNFDSNSLKLDSNTRDLDELKRLINTAQKRSIKVCKLFQRLQLNVTNFNI